MEPLLRDGFVFESLVALVHNKGTIDAQFAGALAEQFIHVCEVQDFDLFSALDASMRKTVALLAEHQPAAVWQVLSRFYERASSLERDWLEQLVGPAEHGDNQHAEGLLFRIPEEHLFTWANGDPAHRAAFLCTFYPTLVRDHAGVHTWHPALERLARDFGAHESFRDTLASRLRPTSWWGSIVPFLEVSLHPLETWFAHPIPSLAQWARETHTSIARQVVLEQRRDEEDL